MLSAIARAPVATATIPKYTDRSERKSRGKSRTRRFSGSTFQCVRYVSVGCDIVPCLVVFQFYHGNCCAQPDYRTGGVWGERLKGVGGKNARKTRRVLAAHLIGIFCEALSATFYAKNPCTAKQRVAANKSHDITLALKYFLRLHWKELRRPTVRK